MREIARARRAHFLLAASLFLLGAGIVAGVMLLPSYLIVDRYQSSLEERIAILSAPAADSADKELIKHIQERVDQLRPLIAATSSPSEAIAAALALRPAGISIDHINYTIGKTGTLLLSGSSGAGDQVSLYQHALASSDDFAGVSVPVGALAGVGDGRFNITIVTK
ncbi:hypothetical protein HZC00_01970 [Candidatus Kaiserbacteria bacterium]|nr:hypothetical protein [Candidatus Kaiserbacteria bacterium]